MSWEFGFALRGAELRYFSAKNGHAVEDNRESLNKVLLAFDSHV